MPDALTASERALLIRTVETAHANASHLLNLERRFGFDRHLPENKARRKQLEQEYDNLKTLLGKLNGAPG